MELHVCRRVCKIYNLIYPVSRLNEYPNTCVIYDRTKKLLKTKLNHIEGTRVTVERIFSQLRFFPFSYPSLFLFKKGDFKVIGIS